MYLKLIQNKTNRRKAVKLKIILLKIHKFIFEIRLEKNFPIFAK